MHEEFAYYSPYENMFRLTPEDIKPFNVQLAGMAFCDETYIIYPVSYTHLTLPTNSRV